MKIYGAIFAPLYKKISGKTDFIDWDKRFPDWDKKLVCYVRYDKPIRNATKEDVSRWYDMPIENITDKLYDDVTFDVDFLVIPYDGLPEELKGAECLIKI